jgi:hypothetical protein
MAIVKACNVAGTATRNTGSRCKAMLTQPWMIVFGSTLLEIPADAIEDGDSGFVDWMNTHRHALGSQKVFLYGGNKQPFNDTTTNNTEPTVYTSPVTGARKQMLPGSINLTLNTLDGGLCLAKALLTIGKSDLGIIIFDKDGGFMAKKNANGTYGFFSSYNSPGSLILQVKETPFQNSLNVSINPDTLIQLGEYYVDDQGAIIDMSGLTDVEMDSRAPATTTTGTVGGTFECGGGDIYDEYGTALIATGAWKATKVIDGTDVPITGVAQNTGLKAYVLTHGTLGTGVAVKYDLRTSDVLYGLNVIGIESIKPVIVTTP